MILYLLRLSRTKKIVSLLIVLSLITSSLFYNITAAKAASLTSTNVFLSNSVPGTANTGYTIGWTFPGITSIQCMKILFATTASGSTKPTGMTTTAATKGAITGGGLTSGSWTLWNTNDGIPQYEYATGQASTATAVSIITNNITNSSVAGVYYAQITTYSTLTTHTCSGAVDTAVATFTVKAGQALSVTVDPSLTFALAGVASGQTVNSTSTTATTVTDANTIPLGNASTVANAVIAHDIQVVTNATNGYTVYASYSATLTDASAHTIADHTGTNAAPATFPAAGVSSAFGYTTESSSLSGSATRFNGNKWAKFETINYEVARKATKATTTDTTRIGYQVAVNAGQEAGQYSTTISFTATPTY